MNRYRLDRSGVNRSQIKGVSLRMTPEEYSQLEFLAKRSGKSMNFELITLIKIAYEQAVGQ